MAGSAGTEDYNAAGNSDFSRKAMVMADHLLNEWKAPVADDTGTRKQRYEQGRMPLSMQADQWMAPNVPNGGRTASHAEQIGATLYHGDKKVQLGLEHQAKSWSAPRTSDTNGPGAHGDGGLGLRTQAVQTCESLTWPAPAARDHKGSSASSIIRQDGKVRSDMLDYAAEQFFHPPSSPGQPIAGGAMSSTDGPNSNQPSAKRKLNPIFVEALMRWPTGLSGFERQETAWIRWWQLQRSFVSALCSKPTEPAQPSLL